jgi:hypothetical protein
VGEWHYLRIRRCYQSKSEGIHGDDAYLLQDVDGQYTEGHNKASHRKPPESPVF